MHYKGIRSLKQKPNCPFNVNGCHLFIFMGVEVM